MLSNNTDYVNNLLNRLAYMNIENDWEPGEDLIDIVKDYDPNLASELADAGFSGYKIKDYVNNNDSDSKSGFCAIAFENPETGEVGMSFRGTENLKQIGSDIGGIVKGDEASKQNQIDMIDNIFTAIKGDSAQVQEAIDFYEKNRNSLGNNYLYGHSKGGELASEVFAEYSDEIKQVHIINSQPINGFKLSDEQKKAFNSNKFDATVIDGDIVWQLGGVHYKVRFIENNNTQDGFVGPHDLLSASYDPITGEAIEAEEPYKNYVSQGILGAFACVTISAVQAGYQLQQGDYELIEDVCKLMIKELPEEVQRMFDVTVATYEKVKIYLEDIKDNIEDFIVILAKAVKKYYNVNFNSGYKYATTNPEIKLDTYKLKSYAQRLQAVNRRINNLDKRMDSLYLSVGLLDLWNLIQADLLTGYSWRINRCVSYLENTASDFDSVESTLINKL